MQTEVEGTPIIKIDEFGAVIPGTGIRIDFKRQPTPGEEVITTAQPQTTQQKVVSFLTNNAIYILVGIGILALLIAAIKRK